MRRNLILRAAAAIVVVAGAVVGYVLWIPMQRPNPALLARLAITKPVKGLEPHPTVEEPSASASPIAALTKAVKSTPGEAGVSSVLWKGTKKSSASLVVMALPTTALARSAQEEADDEYVAQDALTTEGFGYGGSFTDDSVPGAKGSYYVPGTTATVKSTGKRADLLVFRVDRVVTLVSVDGTGAPSAVEASAVATAEYHHLLSVGATPRLSETVFPLVSTIVFAVVALVALAALEASPAAFSAVRRRRRDAADAAIRRERASRGAKVVTRRARPVATGRAHSRR